MGCWFMVVFVSTASVVGHSMLVGDSGRWSLSLNTDVVYADRQSVREPLENRELRLTASSNGTLLTSPLPLDGASLVKFLRRNHDSPVLEVFREASSVGTIEQVAETLSSAAEVLALAPDASEWRTAVEAAAPSDLPPEVSALAGLNLDKAIRETLAVAAETPGDAVAQLEEESQLLAYRRDEDSLTSSTHSLEERPASGPTTENWQPATDESPSSEEIEELDAHETDSANAPLQTSVNLEASQPFAISPLETQDAALPFTSPTQTDRALNPSEEENPFAPNDGPLVEPDAGEQDSLEASPPASPPDQQDHNIRRRPDSTAEDLQEDDSLFQTEDKEAQQLNEPSLNLKRQSSAERHHETRSGVKRNQTPWIWIALSGLLLLLAAAATILYAKGLTQRKTRHLIPESHQWAHRVATPTTPSSENPPNDSSKLTNASRIKRKPAQMAGPVPTPPKNKIQPISVITPLDPNRWAYPHLNPFSQAKP